MKTNQRPVLVLAALLTLLASWTVAEEPDLRTQALTAYEDARYDDALALLTRIDAEGRATGPDLYRLYYCQTVANLPEARESQRRAIEALEGELAASTDPDVPFYLANAYRNVGRLTDMQRVATEATSRVESERWPEPKSGIGAFRLGKLYADQGREPQAAGWYERAVTLLITEGQGDSTYARWASRYLGRRAFDSGDFETAARHYKTLLESDEVTVEDLDRLAVASLRTSRYEDASRAWRRAVILEPATSDRPRYAGQLSETAGQLGALPKVTPDGRDLRGLGRGELEQLMADQAVQARTVIAEAGAQPLNEEESARVRARIAEVRGMFVSAGLEYVIQGYPIRETAFLGGYAPLIFRAGDWVVPEVGGAAKGQGKAKAKAPAG